MSGDWTIGATASQYTDFVWRAATHADAFAGFRRDPIYSFILGNLSESQGRAYFDCITDPIIRDICLASEAADTIGSPATFDYGGRRISPETLRYGKMLQDMTAAFPDFHRMDTISEIGIGYGGQARLISEYFKRRGRRLYRYHLIDIAPALRLARLYLDHCHVAFQACYMTSSELPLATNCDLAISNYAFSEFSRELQAHYLDRVLLHARGGFMVMNTGLADSRPHAESAAGMVHAADELRRILPNAAIRDEIPQTGDRNYVMLFGNHAG